MHPHLLWMTRTTKNANDIKQGNAGKARRFGIDHASSHIVLGSVRAPLPKSRFARLGIGFGLMAGGVLGFLPVLGFWMLPLGFAVISSELAIARRWRRQISVWWARKRRRTS
jgi:hypothetical protein